MTYRRPIEPDPFRSKAFDSWWSRHYSQLETTLHQAPEFLPELRLLEFCRLLKA